MPINVDDKGLQQNALNRYNRDAARQMNAEEMVRQLLGRDTSYANLIGQREQARALQNLANQEARMRNVNPALAAALSSRVAPQIGQQANEAIGQNVSQEQKALLDTIFGSRVNRGEQAADKMGSFMEQAALQKALEQQYNQALASQKNQADIADIMGKNAVDISKKTKTPRPDLLETVLGAAGRIVPAASDLYTKWEESGGPFANMFDNW